MPPRLRFKAGPVQQRDPQYICVQCRNASLASATTLAPPMHLMAQASSAISCYPPTQPPSHKPPEFRKSQLHRQYQSILHSSPLMLLFQHNNLKSVEWMGIRRELATALEKVDDELAKSGSSERIGSGMKLQIIQTSIFASALKVVEFWNPRFESETSAQNQIGTQDAVRDPTYTHGLSRKAWSVAKRRSNRRHGLEPLMSGPIALLTFPHVSPQHLKAALSILSPSPAFPAPRRRVKPTYHEPAVQNGLQKLMLLGARVEGKVFDTEGTKWVGGIEGGIDGLRAQLVAMLSGVGAGITHALEAAGRSLYITVEGRRGMLEEEEKGEKS